jgi:hypothetical protein
MFDQDYQQPGTEATTDGRREEVADAPLSGTVLLDDDLVGAAGGLAHIGEQIPQ